MPTLGQPVLQAVQTAAAVILCAHDRHRYVDAEMATATVVALWPAFVITSDQAQWQKLRADVADKHA